MTPTLCHECPHKSLCRSYGISEQLAARLMIGKMVTDETTPYPFSVYDTQLKAEKISRDQAREFIEKAKEFCLYLQ